MARLSIPAVQPRTISVAAFVVVAAASAAWFVNPPVYFTNDDVAIRLALEGGVAPGQPPTGFALFANAALGWAVVAAQRLAPGVPLWDLVVAATLLSAVAVFAATAWTALGTDWMARSAALGALLVPATPLLTGLHYTVAATLAGGAGTLLAVLEIGSRGRPRRTTLALAALLVFVGMLVRPMAAMAGAAAISVFLLPLAATREVRLRHLGGALAAALVLFIAVQSLDVALYSLSPEWAAYSRYQGIVLRLFEWGGELAARDTEAVRAAAAWTPNDWMMLQAAFGVDPGIHGLDRVAKAYDARAAIVGWEGVVRWGVTRLAEIGPADVGRLLLASATALVGGGVLAAIYGGARGTMAAAGLVLLFCAFCLATEVAFKELPFRVLAPLTTCAVAVLIVTGGALGRAPSAFASVIAAGIVLAVASAEVTAAVSGAAAEYRHSQQVDRDVERLQALSPSLLVLHSDTFPSEHWWRPFRRPPIALTAVSLGWNNQSPSLQRFLSQSGRQPLLEALCLDPSVLIVAEEDRLEFVTRYLEEHFGASAEWTDVFAGSFRAWRCVKGGS
jgi:hypothetical protein